MKFLFRVLTGALVLALMAGILSTAAFAEEIAAVTPSWCILDHEHCAGENCTLVHEHCVHISCLEDHDHCQERDCKVDHQHCVHNNCIMDHEHCTAAGCKEDHVHCVHNDCAVDHTHCAEAGCQLSHQHCAGHEVHPVESHTHSVCSNKYSTEKHNGCNNSYTQRRTWYSSYNSSCSNGYGHHSSHH